MSKKAKKTTSAGSAQRPWRDVSTFAGGPGQAWTGYASWALLVAIVAVAATIVFWPKTDTTGADSSTPVVSSPTESGPGICPPAAHNDEDVLPGDLAWVSVDGTSWPVSESVGPKLTDSDVSQCYDRTPVGAALAAVNTIMSVRTADVDHAHRLLDVLFVQNTGKDLSDKQIDETSTEAPSAFTWGRVVGYRVLAFNDELARVQLIEDWVGRGQYTGLTVTLRWQEGDWRVELNDDGQPSNDMMVTVDPDSFTRWADAE